MSDLQKVVDKYFKDSNDNNIENWSREKQDSLKLDAINAVIKLSKNNTFMAEKISDKVKENGISSLDDLSEIDFTTKDELRVEPYRAVCVPKDQLIQMHMSTGTTKGEPIFVFYTLNDLYHFDLYPKYPNLVSVEPGKIVIVALPYELSSSGLAFHKVFSMSEKALVVPAGKGGAYSSPEKTLQLMKKLNADVIITTPSHMAYLYELAVENGYNTSEDFHLEKVWLTGEGCSDKYRERLEEMWGCPAYFYYGSLECGALGIECSEKNGYHIPEAHVHLEIVDPDTGVPCDNGEIGEIVVTTLLREGCPFIRYKTGDLGYIDDVPCACGSTAKKLFLRGRVGDQILIDDGNFSAFYLENILMRVPEITMWYQFVNVDKSLTIRVEKQPTTEISDEELSNKIISEFEYALGVTPTVEIVDKIERVLTKAIRVVKQ